MLKLIISAAVGAVAAIATNCLGQWLSRAPDGSLRKRLGVIILGAGGPGPVRK